MEQNDDFLLDQLKILGFPAWISKYSSLLSLERIQSLFDFSLSPDHPMFIPLLRRACYQKIKRTPLGLKLEDVPKLLKECQNIMVLTGAGVSVSCGIPDFRSQKGIYSRLEEFDLLDPQDMFDLEFFRENQGKAFYQFIKEIYPANFEPSLSHRFIRLLEKQGKLLRNYTQNIDTLEQKAGIERIMQCHGSFSTASCIKCKQYYHGKYIEEYVMQKQVPICQVCKPSKSKRTRESEDEEVEGIIKPDIVFFGESLPKHFHSYFLEDRSKVDLLIVMGSSLKVSPVADIVERIPNNVPQILINLDPLNHLNNHFDVQLIGYCDTIVEYLVSECGWNEQGFNKGTIEIDQCEFGYVFNGARPDLLKDNHALEETNTEDSSSDETTEQVDLESGKDHKFPA